MKKGLITTILALVVVFVTGCVGVSPPPEEEVAIMGEEETVPPIGEEVNFRLWISDEANAIEDFDELMVTISDVAMVQADGNGLIKEPLDPPAEVDLTELTGDNATEIWSGTLSDGKYTKVFLYVTNVTGTLNGDGPGEPADVKLPSDKLQISKPFTISSASGQVVDFVFDITVIEAGQSGKYNLLPQIAQSGPGQDIDDVTSTGKPEDKGKPEDNGEPEGEEAGQDATPPVISVSGVTNDQQYTESVTPIIEVSDDTDPEPAVTATLNGAPFVSGTEVSQVGEHELKITATDASGNEAESSVNFEIVEVGDTTAPVIDVSGIANGQQYTESVTPIIEVSDDTDPEPAVTVTLNGAPFVSGTEVSQVGEHELKITATDASGNEAEVTIEFKIVAAE